MRIIDRIRLGGEGFLVLLLLFLLWHARSLQKANEDLLDKNATLQANLKSAMSLSNNKLIYVWRDKDGKVHRSTRYVPPEGGIETKVPIAPGGTIAPPSTGSIIRDTIRKVEDAIIGVGETRIVNPETGEVVIIRTTGICFRPAVAGLFGIPYGYGVGIQSRLAYAGRWGAGVGLGAGMGWTTQVGTRESIPFMYGFIDRRIDDFIPLLRNTAVGMHGGYGWEKGEKVGGLNISIFF